MKLVSPEISIIVPVFNMEKYLRECLDSLTAQTFTGWECILVNDGSSDSSQKICEEYVAADQRFRLINRQNAGLAAARNVALTEAKGRYIAFVDSDDFVYPDYLKVMHNLIVEYDVDVVQVGVEMLFTTFSRRKGYVESRVKISRDRVATELMADIVIPSYMWNKLFKHEVIDSTFPEGKTFEDLYAMTEWTKNIHEMVLSPEILYVYRQREGSIVNSRYVENRLNYLQMMLHRAKVLRKLEPDAISDKMYERCVWKGLINAGKSIARNVGDEDERKDAIMKVARFAADAPQPRFEDLGPKRWLRASLLLRHPFRFMKLTRALNKLNYQKKRKINHRFS